MEIPFFYAAMLLGWCAALVWASITAILGQRMWATSLLVIGSICMLVAALGLGADSFLPFRRSTLSGTVLGVVGPLCAFLLLIGAVLLTTGFVGLCLRFGLAERRARELEQLVAHLQERDRLGS